MKQEKTENGKGRPILLRCVALVLVFMLAAGALGVRLGQLQIDQAAEWENRASRQQLGSVTIPAQRGNIYDANMKLLAQSATVWTIETSPEALNQSRVTDKDGKYTDEDPARVAAREFAAILELDEEKLYEKLSNKESMYYLVKRKVEKPLAEAVREVQKQHNLRGIYFVEDTRRYYPYEQMASTVLGFVGDDNNGLEGIERWYDEALAGTPGRTTMVRDAKGREITTGVESTVYPPEDGHSLVLTLDGDIQRSLEKYLGQAVENNGVKQRGFAIAMDVNTGAVLGLAVYPSYDPNKPYDIVDPNALALLETLSAGSEEYAEAQSTARWQQWRNKALADTYEPGSVFKVITAAAALDSGKYTLDSPFQCGGSIMVPGWDEAMRCANHTAHGSLDLRHAIIESCNVSFIQISAGLGRATWYDYLRAFGLTEPTGIDLPGEPSLRSIQNLIYAEEQMGPVELASCSFGQSHKYTAVQMITAFCAAINGGNLMQPYIVDRELDAAGNVVKQYSPVAKRQVVSPETSAQLRQVMEQLVSNSDGGSWAYKAGYRIGGKSGTSQKLDVQAQMDEDEPAVYISSFAGFAPADEPQIAVLMALDEPEDTTGNNFFGGRLVGPYVKEILVESLNVLGMGAVFETDEELARNTVKVPKLTEKDVARASKELGDLNLDYEVVGDGGTVLGQMPAAYSEIPYAGKVILYTDASITQEMVTVPNFVGRGPQAAIELAKSLGLNVRTDGAPDSTEGGRINSQSLEAGSTAPRGSVVVLIVEGNVNVGDL